MLLFLDQTCKAAGFWNQENKLVVNVNIKIPWSWVFKGNFLA